VSPAKETVPVTEAERRRERLDDQHVRAISHIGVTDDLPERDETHRLSEHPGTRAHPLRYFDYFLTAAYLPSTWMPLLCCWSKPPLGLSHLVLDASAQISDRPHLFCGLRCGGRHC